MRTGLQIPSAGTVIALLALVMAMAGAAYGAATIGPNKLKSNAVRTSKLADAAVTAPKIANGSVITPKFGPQAVAPQAIESGYADAPNYYAQVSAFGVIGGSRSRNINSADVAKAGTGTYCFSKLPFSPSGGQVVADAGNSVTAVTAQFGLTADAASGCPAAAQAYVRTRRSDTGALIDNGFFVTIY